MNAQTQPSATPGMRILRTQDCEEWNAVLRQSVQHDFHHLAEYHRVAEQRNEGVAHLFTYREAGCTVALPLLIRPVDAAVAEGWKDATSVYGYGGPVVSHAEIPQAVLRNFQAALREALTAQQVVAVFSRMHPLLQQREMLSGLGEYLENGQTISIDLTQPEEQQWARYRKTCRASVNKLQRLGFVGIHDREKRYLPEFVSVYLETMRRVHARDSYLFDTRYFDLLSGELGNVSQLFVALFEGKVAAATLCTICDGIVQDHLGGTRDEFLKFSPDRLVVDTERRWASGMGARVFHLGGGVGAQQDSLFQYKAGFSDRRHTFFTWRWITAPAVYDALCAEKALSNAAHGWQAVSAEYFPAYRCPTVPLEGKVSASSALPASRPAASPDAQTSAGLNAASSYLRNVNPLGAGEAARSA